MRHQNLIELHNLVKRLLVTLTNDAYSINNKFSFRVDWDKGTDKIEDGQGKVFSKYYVLTFYIIDKNNTPLGEKRTLLRNYYVQEIGITPEKLEEQAYQELLLNGLRSLFNNTYASLLAQKEKEVIQAKDVKIDETIEQLREQAERPSLVVLPKFKINP